MFFRPRRSPGFSVGGGGGGNGGGGRFVGQGRGSKEGKGRERRAVRFEKSYEPRLDARRAPPLRRFRESGNPADGMRSFFRAGKGGEPQRGDGDGGGALGVALRFFALFQSFRNMGWYPAGISKASAGGAPTLMLRNSSAASSPGVCMRSGMSNSGASHS